MTFVATPPDYNGNRSSSFCSSICTGDRSDTSQGSRFFVINARMMTLARSIGRTTTVLANMKTGDPL